MWQKFQNAPTDKKEDDNVPPFLDKYIEYKFGLFDRTGKVIHIWCVLNPGRLKKTCLWQSKSKLYWNSFIEIIKLFDECFE